MRRKNDGEEKVFSVILSLQIVVKKGLKPQFVGRKKIPEKKRKKVLTKGEGVGMICRLSHEIG